MKKIKALRFSFTVHVKAFRAEYSILLLVLLLVAILAAYVWGVSPHTLFHTQESTPCCGCGAAFDTGYDCGYDACTSETESCRDGKAFCSSIGFLASAVGILTIIFTIATLKKTQQLFEAQMLIEYDEKYAKPSMCSALRTLREFSNECINHYIFAEHRNEEYNPESKCIFTQQPDFKWTRAVDSARREVKFYFINPYDLYIEGKVSKSIFLQIINKSGIVLFFDVVEKLEFFTNPNYDSYKFYHIMLLASEIYEKQKLDSAKHFELRNRVNRIID